MSILTDFLKLFKYEAADDSDTFNIETALNENWDKIDDKTKTLAADIDKKIPLTQKGKPGGVASLDSTGKVPSAELPAMNYDPAGSAEAVDANLTMHKADKANPHAVTAAQVGAVPASRTVNGKALNANIALTYTDVGADPAGTASAEVSTHNTSITAHSTQFEGKADKSLSNVTDETFKTKIENSIITNNFIFKGVTTGTNALFTIKSNITRVLVNGDSIQVQFHLAPLPNARIKVTSSANAVLGTYSMFSLTGKELKGIAQNAWATLIFDGTKFFIQANGGGGEVYNTLGAGVLLLKQNLIKSRVRYTNSFENSLIYYNKESKIGKAYARGSYYNGSSNTSTEALYIFSTSDGAIESLEINTDSYYDGYVSTQGGIFVSHYTYSGSVSHTIYLGERADLSITDQLSGKNTRSFNFSADDSKCFCIGATLYDYYVYEYGVVNGAATKIQEIRIPTTVGSPGVVKNEHILSWDGKTKYFFCRNKAKNAEGEDVNVDSLYRLYDNATIDMIWQVASSIPVSTEFHVTRNSTQIIFKSSTMSCAINKDTGVIEARIENLSSGGKEFVFAEGINALIDTKSSRGGVVSYIDWATKETKTIDISPVPNEYAQERGDRSAQVDVESLIKGDEVALFLGSVIGLDNLYLFTGLVFNKSLSDKPTVQITY